MTDQVVTTPEALTSEEYPAPRKLGNENTYVPARPEAISALIHDVRRLVEDLHGDANALSSAINEVRSVDSSGHPPWLGRNAQRFGTVADDLPRLIHRELIPTLEEIADELQRYRSRIERLRAEARHAIQDGEAHDHQRVSALTRKRSKAPNSSEVPKLQHEVSAHQNAVRHTLHELDNIRDEKRQADLQLGGELDHASLTLRKVANEASQTVLAGVHAPIAVGPAVGAGDVHVALPHITTADGVGDASTDVGVNVGEVDNPALLGVVRDDGTPLLGTTSGGGLTSLPRRLDPEFPVGPGTDLSAAAALSTDAFRAERDNRLPEAAAGAALLTGAAIVGGAKLIGGGGGSAVVDAPALQPDAGDDGGPVFTAAAAAGHVATTHASARRRLPADEDQDGIGVAIPLATVAAGAVVGFLVAAIGGGLPTSGRAIDLATGMHDRVVRAGRRLLGRRALDALRDDLANRADTVRDDGTPQPPSTVVLPGGLLADVPHGWSVVADDDCAVITPGRGTFGSNIVVVRDRADVSAATAGIEDLAGSVLLEAAPIVGAVSGARSRFGYTADVTSVTVHRFHARTAGGAVIVTASVATDRFAVEAHALDLVLASLRPAA